MSKKAKRGGARIGAGAKPKEDTKKPITFYIYQSAIDRNGGKEAIKAACIKQYQ